MTVVYLFPAILSLLALFAHFLRSARLVPMVLVLGVLGLVAVPRPWAARVVQVALGLGVIEWLRTVADLVVARAATGEPVRRAAIILGGVAVVTALSALLFHTPRLRARYHRARRQP